jgi:transmembrane sensor
LQESAWAAPCLAGTLKGAGDEGNERSIVTVPTWTPESDPLLEEALDWVIRLKTGVPTRSDVEALQSWRQRSPAHDAAFRRAVLVFRRAGAAARELADEQQEPTEALAVPPRWPSHAPTRRVVLAGSVVAVAAYMTVRPPLGLWPSIGELSADYRTGKGEHRKVMVAPDIALEMSTQTSVALLVAPAEIRVELIAGEASVMARQPSPKPLVLRAGDGIIRAMQAEFNARCLDGIVAVTCLDGTVTVEQDHAKVELRKSEQVTYSSAGLQASGPVNAAQVSAWRTGLLIFRDQPLARVVEEVNRYRPGRIIVTSGELNRRLVNGTFQVDKLDNFVAQVEQLFGARVIALPAGVVLLG